MTLIDLAGLARAVAVATVAMVAIGAAIVLAPLVGELVTFR